MTASQVVIMDENNNYQRGPYYPLLLALSFSALYCAVEQWLIRPGYHPFFILIGALFLIGTDQPDHRIRFSGAKAGEVRS